LLVFPCIVGPRTKTKGTGEKIRNLSRRIWIAPAQPAEHPLKRKRKEKKRKEEDQNPPSYKHTNSNMSQFTEQEFFGGTIRGVVPQGWIDSRLVYNSPMHEFPILFLQSNLIQSQNILI
jgi:hypothetical protein